MLLTQLPSARKQIDDELNQALSDLDKKMVVRDPSLPLHKQLPGKGLSKEVVENHLVALGGLEHSKWEEGVLFIHPNN